MVSTDHHCPGEKQGGCSKSKNPILHCKTHQVVCNKCKYPHLKEEECEKCKVSPHSWLTFEVAHMCQRVDPLRLCQRSKEGEEKRNKDREEKERKKREKKNRAKEAWEVEPKRKKAEKEERRRSRIQETERLQKEQHNAEMESQEKEGENQVYSAVGLACHFYYF